MWSAEVDLPKQGRYEYMAHMGDGRDVACAVLYLVSDEAKCVTGTEILVDGGLTPKST